MREKKKQPLCAKCGACTSVCPVYKITGRESLSARGKIHLLSKQTNLKSAGGLLPDLFSKCLLCGACSDTCPRGIDVCELVQEARETMPEVSGLPGIKKFLCRQILAQPTLLHLLGATAKSLQAIEKILPPTSGLRLRFGLPVDNDKFHRQSTVSANPNKNNNQEAKVLYFSGCMANYLASDIRHSSTKLLNTMCKMPVGQVNEQVCCGMAALASGNKQQAKELAIKNIKSFTNGAHSDLPIFTSCATCYSQLKSYGKLLGNDPKWSNPAAKFSSRVWEFSTFLLHHAQNITNSFQASEPQQTVFYHDPCHLRFKHNTASKPILAAPRQLLKFLPGLKLTELPHGAQCCGQGGLFNIAHPDLSKEIGHNILKEFYQSGATTVTTTCSGCLAQWQQLLAAKEGSYSAIHLAILLTTLLNE